MGLEQALQDGQLLRQVHALIVAHLRDNNLTQAATAVATATMTPLNIEVVPNKLLDLVYKGLAAEREEAAKGASPIPAIDCGAGPAAISAGYGPIPTPPVNSLDFRLLKLLNVLQPINDLDFHPQSAVLISGAKDHTIKFFDFAKTAAKRAFRVIQDTHNVRSVAFHPSGDFLLAGTDHHVAHLYDINTFQCYLSSTLQETDAGGAINQVRYSSNGGLYVTSSKDGGVRIWDGVAAQCVRAIIGAHGSAEATSASFTNDQRTMSGTLEMEIQIVAC